jgi:single-strand selective monofunctional uracil DNA glycosylase
VTAAAIIAEARRLSRDAGRIRFGHPVHYVYNPLEYAREPHELYLARYAAGRKRIVLLGMNPGPWGMAQTGVPFGEIAMVSEWLGIRGSVKAPAGGHPRVKVQGFECARHEVSGTRLWGFLRGRYGTANEMARELFVSNYCPLLFLDEAGRNITPDHLARPDQPALFEACDRFLRVVIETIQPQWLVGVGRFAERRLQAVVEKTCLPGRVTSITHPSPANPRSQKDWGATVSAALVEQGVFSASAASRSKNT